MKPTAWVDSRGFAVMWAAAYYNVFRINCEKLIIMRRKFVFTTNVWNHLVDCKHNLKTLNQSLPILNDNMNKNEHTKYWLESADHDLETAESMFQTEKYDWCLFIGHLVLEKTLKAIFVDRNNNNMPPKTHNLVRLAEISKIELPENEKILLDKITDFNIQTRYPDYKFDFYKRCTEQYSSKYFLKIKEVNSWLRSLIK